MFSMRKVALVGGVVLLRSGLHDLFGGGAKSAVMFWGTLASLAVLGQGIVMWLRAKKAV